MGDGGCCSLSRGVVETLGVVGVVGDVKVVTARALGVVELAVGVVIVVVGVVGGAVLGECIGVLLVLGIAGVVVKATGFV